MSWEEIYEMKQTLKAYTKEAWKRVEKPFLGINISNKS